MLRGKPEPNFRGPTDLIPLLRGEVAEHACDADGIHPDFELGGPRGKALLDDVRCQARAGERVRPGIGDLRLAGACRLNEDRRFQRVGTRLAARADHSDAIGAVRDQLNVGDIEDDVRRE